MKMNKHLLNRIKIFLESEIAKNPPFVKTHNVFQYKNDIKTLVYVNYELLTKEETKQ